MVIKPCTAAEVTFYETCVASHPEFAALLPTFFGTLQLNDPAAPPGGNLQPSSTTAPATHNRHTNIVLSNIAYGFTHPCILDVKLGAQLWDEAASAEKRARLDAVSNSTTSGSLGFRVAGMRVYKGVAALDAHPAIDGTGYRAYDKHYGRVFTAENVIDALREYFTSEISPDQVRLVVERFRRKVDEIKTVLENQESRMYSASLLFCYEGGARAFEDALKEEAKQELRAGEEEEKEEEGEEGDEKVAAVKLIDFAHASWTPGLGPDENALQGVRSIEKLLKQFCC